MKRIFILALTLASSTLAIAQNVGINSTGAAPDASAILDVASTSKGLLVPRVALTAINAAGPITSPLTSLLVYNTATAGSAPNNVVPGYYYWNGTEWVAMIGNGGNVGIGIGPDPNVRVSVDAGTAVESAIFASGDINSFLEINVQNSNNGNLASSDIVATANNGTDNSVYVDMGINSQSYANGGGPNALLNGSNTAYMYAHGNDFKIGNGTPNKPLVFFTNPSTGTLGTNTAHGVERIRIAQDGKVGVGDYSSADPKSIFEVTGSVGHSIITTSSSPSLDATNYTVILTGGNPSVTLPTASTCTGRIYIIVNQITARTISTYKDFAAANSTTIPANSSITVQSDGSNWYRIH
jgi:hypothetical protein